MEPATLSTILSLTGALAYVLAGARLIADSENTARVSIPRWGLIAVALHTASIISASLQYQGVSSSFFDALSITALIVVATTLACQLKQAVTALLIPVFFIAAICLAQASFFSHHTPISATSSGMLVHILSSIIAYSLLSLATLQALALQRLENNLKHRDEHSWMQKLPPLQTLEALLFQTVAAGWLLLTLSLVSGALFIDDLFAQHLAHKTLFSLLSWLLFGVLLLGRQYYGWRGRTALHWILVAFFSLLLAYFGSKFVFEVLLQRS